MRKFIIIIGVFCLLAQVEVSAQVKSSALIAPDVTFTDLDGNEHVLYDVLSSGKSVIIDFFATWCSPCWDYHLEGDLQEIWEAYGPNGTDEIVIFYVEADGDTPTSDLSGASNTSYGNYLENSPYATVESHHLGNQFNISYFPTVYYICPDKRYTEIGQIPFEEMSALLESGCPAPTSVDDIEILFYTNELNPACGLQSVLPSVKIQNIGTNMVKEIAGNLYMNGELSADSPFSWDFWLDTYETTELVFGPYDISENTTFTVDLFEVNGEEDPNTEYNVMTAVKDWPISYDQEINLILDTDLYGDETSWELWDELGNLVSAGEYYPPDTTVILPIQLINTGCYEFKIFDSFGDGMCCNFGDGAYRLEDSAGKILFSGGNFLDEEISFFELSALTADLEQLTIDQSISIYPNPASDNVSLYLPFGDDEKRLTISDASGKILITQSTKKDYLSLSIEQWPMGIYYVSVTGSKSATNGSFVIAR